jgi:hypothetical protein
VAAAEKAVTAAVALMVLGNTTGDQVFSLLLSLLDSFF